MTTKLDMAIRKTLGVARKCSITELWIQCLRTLAYTWGADKQVLSISRIEDSGVVETVCPLLVLACWTISCLCSTSLSQALLFYRKLNARRKGTVVEWVVVNRTEFTSQFLNINNSSLHHVLRMEMCLGHTSTQSNIFCGIRNSAQWVDLKDNWLDEHHQMRRLWLVFLGL